VRGCFQLLPVGNGIVGIVGAVVPDNIQFLSALKRSPGIVGDYRDATQRLEGAWRPKRIDGNRLTNTHDLQGRFLIVRLNLSSEDRGMFDRGVQHSVQLRVHAEDSLARTYVVKIVTLDPLADITPSRLFLELQIFFPGNRQLRCGRGEFAIAKAPIGCRMHDSVQIGDALSGRNFPLLCRGLDEHEASGRTGLPHNFIEVANGMGAVSILVAIARIAESLLNLDSLPVGIEFIGYYERKSRANLRAHFGASGNNVDRPIDVDSNKHAGTKTGRIQLRFIQDGFIATKQRGRKVRPEEERSRTQDAVEKSSAADVGNRGYGCASVVY